MSRSHLLKALLERQFPQFCFQYFRFNKACFGSTKGIDAAIRKQCVGVIAELKQLKSSTLAQFDHMVRQFAHKPLIFILSPQSFRVLSEKRKKILFENMMVISELKSLDYLTQLPRLMEEVSLRQKLQIENEKLLQLINSEISVDASLNRALNDSQNVPTQKGLKIRLLKWNQIRSGLSNAAQTEILEAFTRMISRAVRSNDRVLHNRDNEFLVFLSNIDRTQQTRCVQRVKEKLSSIQISANTKEIRVPFSVDSIDQLPFMS